MKEFKTGDRVLVRNNDLAEWEVGVFINLKNGGSHPFSVRLEKNDRTFSWSQCRHIDEFRAGDKVQVSDDGIEWQDAVYVGCIYSADNDYVHAVTNELYNLIQYKLCRWHPSMPWAEKEEIIDEPHWVKTIFRRLDARLDAIELKLNEK